MNKLKTSRRLKKPDCIGKIVQCGNCGGLSKVGSHTSLFFDSGTGSVVCPYCKSKTFVKNDIFKHNKERLLKFITSQVEPIKAINDENIRLPLQKLLDDFFNLLNE